LSANSYAASTKEEYELQERCGKRAEEIFRIEYRNGNKAGKMSNYTNHYNRKLNRCFVIVIEIQTSIPDDKEIIEKVGFWTDKPFATLMKIRYMGTSSNSPMAGLWTAKS